MFDDSYERRLLQQCSPVSKKASVLVRPEPMDRFIPCRLDNNWKTSFQAIRRGTENQPAKKPRGDGGGGEGAGGGRDHLAYDCLLRNELLKAQIEELRGPPATCADGGRAALGAVQLASQARAALAYSPPVFRFRAPAFNSEENIDPSPYSLSPLSAKSQKLLRSPRKATRKISRIPFKVLDAPELQDDFYLNLVDWSAQNVLSVGLGSCVYLWSACTSQVTRLCDLSAEGNAVTSVAWSERGQHVAVGTQKGHISVWDVAVNKEVTKLQGHIARVGALAWNGDMLSSGSRDRHIRQRDTRTPPVQSSRILQGHRQEVCGLKWSPDGQSLASGGNDNKLFVWSMHSTSPVQTYGAHVAAVKAIAWSPHQHGLLASGGGTADRCIRFWNTLTAQPMHCVDTGSQVCNLAWSKHSSELVSTHGYSQNQILVWKYPSLTQVAKLTGHSYRVLYLALSPDGEAIVTGAGDETLRFWNVFSKTPSHKENKSVLNLYTALR
ncbi:Fizzy- protein [Plutella xylostella]|uniref:Fizzy- protein n=1 Tax=Plutella xylostella TaxID=51655 RepID=A0ABQ7QFA5_PLUXY|nr:fizzy-related protein homolog isoform X1 [Plutella xylostella]XP_048482094.1 fizzy-related protein homolog isoform X2 [Plutella xylostella]XP_048482095.1 fizzy-related protein homolog isoform X3 [Plutella xylostella]KAG7303906.1 Fizzy- protein [Plutella xylostella]